jgi:ferredoxin, 2Fe-2S
MLYYENHGAFVLGKLWAWIRKKGEEKGEEKAPAHDGALLVYQAQSEPVRIALKVPQKESLLEIVLDHSIDISHSCGGMGTCGTCRIEILEARHELVEMNEIEREMALERGFLPQERLACQTRPIPGLKIRIP